ncbi:MAG TPA: FAD binding domain-containing protein, partial [Candidatus Acidoferrales bacterium]|nr:FAD binding domain-containing protein [Candidatus Acidoferrales bacterium]
AAGTLAGNLAFAEPHADPPALLMALGARVIVEGSKGRRAIPVDEFVVGMYQTSLGPDEIVTAIEVPVPDAGRRAAYVKFQILERPSVGVAIVGAVQGGRFGDAPAVVVGAADEKPRRVNTKALSGAALRDPATADALATAARAVVDPVADLAGDAEYKRHLVGVFARRALAALAEAA